MVPGGVAGSLSPASASTASAARVNYRPGGEIHGVVRRLDGVHGGLDRLDGGRARGVHRGGRRRGLRDGRVVRLLGVLGGALGACQVGGGIEPVGVRIREAVHAARGAP